MLYSVDVCPHNSREIINYNGIAIFRRINSKEREQSFNNFRSSARSPAAVLRGPLLSQNEMQIMEFSREMDTGQRLCMVSLSIFIISIIIRVQ